VDQENHRLTRQCGCSTLPDVKTPHTENLTLSERPNFIFITTDEQRWDTLTCTGNTAIRTPHLDALAERGTRFSRAYPSNPICMPSRATMITGRSQRGHQVFEHGINLSENMPVIGDAFHEVGYTTALFGKAHFKVWELEDSLPEHPPTGSDIDPSDGLWHGPYYGFDYVSHGSHAPNSHWRIFLEREHPESLALWEPEAALEPQIRSGAWHNAIPKEHHHTHFFTDQLIDWLGRRETASSDDPFFAWLSFPDPHGPFCPPAPYCYMYDPADMPSPVPLDDDLDNKPPHYRWSVTGERSWYGGGVAKDIPEDQSRQVRALYYGQISFIDDMVGRVIDALDRLNLTDTTYVVFTSDHGEMIDDHGQSGKPPMTYESVIRVPLIWQGPSVRPSTVHDGVMTHTDLVPTFLDLAGAPPLLGMEGRSYTKLLQGDTESHRDAVIVERIGIERHTSEPIVRQKILVTDRYKLAHYGSSWPGELYDLHKDPEEFTNLWDDPEYHEIRTRMTERMLAEIIDDELGDPVDIFLHQPLAPVGSFRDPIHREPTEGYRRRTTSSASQRYLEKDPHQRKRKETKDPRLLENERLAEERQQRNTT